MCILHITKLETTPINLANLSNVEKKFLKRLNMMNWLKKVNVIDTCKLVRQIDSNACKD